MNTAPLIAPMESADAAQVIDIYRLGIATGNATFETEAPSWDRFTNSHLSEHRFVARDHDRVLGWVACSKVSDRSVYAGVVEHSVYVHPDARGRRIGLRLLETLIESTEKAGIWTIQSGVFPENTASLALHRAVGFRAIGTREKVGRHDGVWRDVILLERRSPSIL
jgi:L-amino acid N-acyltransferase YncA